MRRLGRTNQQHRLNGLDSLDEDVIWNAEGFVPLVLFPRQEVQLFEKMLLPALLNLPLPESENT